MQIEWILGQTVFWHLIIKSLVFDCDFLTLESAAAVSIPFKIVNIKMKHLSWVDRNMLLLDSISRDKTIMQVLW